MKEVGGGRTHVTVKLQNTRDKEEILKPSGVGGENKGTGIRITSDFSTVTLEDRRQ